MDSLSRDLVKSFAEVVNEPKQKEPVRYVRGTITGKGDAKYVQLDGSTVATPISEVVDAQEGDRVLVSIENHRAVIVGNFTFSPSARQEQEALEKAEGAENTANSAGETANAAQLAAQEASKNANEAMGAASAASSSAAEAKDQAADAMVAAGNAQASANEAKESATQANENATQAKTDAANAQAAVANANEEIGKINDAIETAQGEIDQALDDLHSQADEIIVIKRDYSTKVETENVKAELSTQITESVGQLQTTIQENYYTKNDIVEIQGNLQSQITQNAEGLSSQATKIESLESDTAEAQKQVDQALEKANAAQQAATQAQQDAATANEAAEKAQNEAVTAAEKAQNANDAALDAKLAAHVADKALADAREALDQARENYKNVVSNPGSTAEDIASAAAQVETARQAVETALEDAAEAQYVANKAQEAADVAQEEANAASQAAQTAQNKADAAEQAANNAQAAAEQAAENVAALTKRVTTAETKIDQNAEQISLNATKTEEIGDKLVNDYYSKTETDALIKVESDRITSTVSKVETVEKTAITSTIEEFYLSRSPTSLSGGSWVTTQPTWTQGKYIWRRTKVTKGDGTTSYSPSQNGVCITGNTGAKGDTGATGATGNGISKTEVYYYLSTSNTTQSGGSWSTTVPAWIDGRYYWQKIKTTYTNGNSSESTPVCITGGKGATGATGNTGATGKGVSSITIEFYLSNSKTTQSGGSWTTTMPTWTSGKYLWTRNKIVYTNPASTVYTTPICDSSWEAVNEIEIGGRNLWPNSSFNRGLSTYTLVNVEGSVSLDSQKFNNNDVLVLERSGFKGSGRHYVMTKNSPGIKSYKAGEEYILSAYIYIEKALDSDSPSSEIMVRGSAGDSPRAIISKTNQTGKWIKIVSPIFKPTTDGTFNNCFVLLGKNGKIKISQIKLEKGNKATDWTPAPEDIEEDLSAVEKRVTSAEQKLTSTQWSLWFTEVVNNSVATSTKFTMDKNGLHIKGGGIDISNNAGTKVFYADTSGNLVIKNLTATNGTFSGTINATSGKIGGWTIENNRLISDYMIIDSTEGISTTISRNGYQGLKIRNTGISFYSQYEQNRFIGQIFSTRNTSLGTYTLFIGGAQSDILALGTRKADGEGYSSSLTVSTNSEVQPYPLRINDEFDVTEASHFKDSVHIESATLYFETSSNGIIFREPGWIDGFRMSPTFSGSGDSQYMSFAVSGSTGGGAGEWTGNGITAFRVYIGSGNTEFFRPIYCTGNNMVVRSGNQNTTITNNWIGFYRASDGGRVGWMGANTTNDLYISPEKGVIRLAGQAYFAASGTRIYGEYTNGSNNIYIRADSGYGALYSQGTAIYFNLKYVDSNWTHGKFYPGASGVALGGSSSSQRWYRLYASNACSTSSDMRLKENIKYLNSIAKAYKNSSDTLIDIFFKSLKPSSFNLKDDKYKRLKFGFIAQDVIKSLENIGLTVYDVDFVSHGRDENGNISEEAMYGLCYEEFIALNTHMIQKANTTIQSQQKEIDDLKKQVQDLQELVLSA